MVVIAVIALMLGLVSAALARSRQVARTAVCAANLKQIGTLVEVYLNDSKGTMPTLFNRATTADAQPALDTALGFKEDSDGIMACPSDDRKVYENSGTSYFWNFTVNGQKVDTMFSIMGGRDHVRIPLVSDKEGWHPELDPKVNILYADTHVSQQLNFSVSLP